MCGKHCMINFTLLHFAVVFKYIRTVMNCFMSRLYKHVRCLLLAMLFTDFSYLVKLQGMLTSVVFIRLMFPQLNVNII